jgi:hypothetical protein
MRKDMVSQQKNLALNSEKRISNYHTQTFWILLAAFTISLCYEVYRDTVMAGATSFDAFNPALAIFYVACFGMTFLVRVNRRWISWAMLFFTLGLIAVGMFYYDPEILPARHPGYVDWFESVVYLGLLFIAAFLCLQEVCGRTLIPGAQPAS